MMEKGAIVKASGKFMTPDRTGFAPRHAWKYTGRMYITAIVRTPCRNVVTKPKNDVAFEVTARGTVGCLAKRNSKMKKAMRRMSPKMIGTRISAESQGYRTPPQVVPSAKLTIAETPMALPNQSICASLLRHEDSGIFVVKKHETKNIAKRDTGILISA